MSGLTSVYPPPPAWFQLFTDENRSQVREALDGGKEVIPELAPLVPPAVPEEPTFRGFGSVWNTKEQLLPLAESGIPQLYPEHESRQDLVPELKKLLGSALAAFVSVVDTMGANPTAFESRIESLRVILINMHHLLNVYRPHQAREGLVMHMTQQIEKKRHEIAEMRVSNNAISDRLDALASRVPKKTASSCQDEELTEWEGIDL